jgi:DNA-directed RNA polymerase specialized sigma24 family protein
MAPSQSQVGSVTCWVEELRGGDPEAARPLWERYFERLVRVARARLRAAGRTGGAADEEDAALSAFNSFCQRARLGQFANLRDRDDLWRLLVIITARKALDQVQRDGRRKRGGGRVLRQADRPVSGADDAEVLGGLDQVVGPGPNPAFAALVAEEYRRRLDALDDETLRRIALEKLEGFANAEIAARLGCSLRTVANRLERIRQIWRVELQS